MSILKPMTSSEFDKYLENSIKSYAKEKIEAGNWSEDEALHRAEDEYKKLLYDGVKTPGNYLFSIVDENEEVVGMIWLCEKENKSSFIYEIRIKDEYQGKGYGKKAMKEIESVAKSLGLEKIELHVFGHNMVAINLYKALDYETTNVLMSKKL